MKENNNLEVLKTLQATLNIIVKNEEEAQEKNKDIKLLKMRKEIKLNL